MRPHVATALATALLLPLAGCLAPEALLPWGPALAGENVPTAPWGLGSYWTYHATFRSGRGLDVALVVHEATNDAYRLGTNLTAGFFGLPFDGTVTRGNLNPVIGDAEWRLFDFPLVAGKSWEHELFGHTARTTVRAATLELPNGTAAPGFELESTAYGRLFATYTYAPSTGWFTRLTLIEPTDGVTVLDVRLTGFGDHFGAEYFVEKPVARLAHAYPGLDGADTIRLPEGAKIAATLTLRGELGEFRARLLSPRGAPALVAEVHGSGVAIERATFPGTAGAWRLDHLGLGTGMLRLDLTAIVPARGGEPPEDAAAERVDLRRLLQPPEQVTSFASFTTLSNIVDPVAPGIGRSAPSPMTST